MSSSALNGDSERVMSPVSTPSSINNDTTLSHSLEQLSINTASSTELPPSPLNASPSRLGYQRAPAASPNGKGPPRSPLRRSSSSLSQDARASTPTLLRKASMNSLHGVSGVTPSRSSSSRRSSAAHITSVSSPGGKAILPGIEDTEPPPVHHTAASVASTHFKKELDLHHGTGEAARSVDTVAILHDSCYGHRFSRPRTSKASLSTIVERPERIQASILGLSVAYVRLGERHAEGRYPLHPSRDLSSIPSTPFGIRKTNRRLPLSSQAVTNVHGVKWMEELNIMCDNAEARLAMNGKELARPDIPRGPDQDAPAKLHEGDLYLCSESLNAMEGALGAVCESVDTVFQGSASGKGPHRAFVIIRPPGHHCSASYPSGFCWLNNVHVGISHAALTHGLTHAAIIDFDLHHGDGSQAITWEHNRRANTLPKNALPWKKTSIGYFSLHDINSYPCEMGDEEKVKNASLCIENAHGQSIWNVHLQPWKSESEFWDLYETKYSVLLEKTRNYLRAQTDRLRQLPNGPKPKAAIFLSAGFDASEWESSGMQRHKVNVPTEFYARLTRDVVKLAAEEGTGVEGRVISVLEGGYSDRALCSGVFSHLSGMTSGTPIVIQKEAKQPGLGFEMGQKIGTFNGTENSTTDPIPSGVQTYDPSWWGLHNLELLDATINPSAPATEPKRPRDGPTPTYSSPTQSFIAKVSSPNARRSVSGMSVNGISKPYVPRVPTPPPPEVDWTVAAHELSKLLIPTERQTMSCKPEELSAEATRARRDRQSILTPPASTIEQIEIPNPRMALRARKPAKIPEATDEEAQKKPVAKVDRRKTVAGTALLANEKATSRGTTPMPEPSYTKPTAQSARRLSLASNTGSVTSEASRPVEHRRIPSNNSTTSLPRPVASQNARPDSSLGHSIPPVVVKKSRVPSQSRAEPAKPRARRKSPLNVTGSGSSIQDGALPSQSRIGTGQTASHELSNSQMSDMDNLTSGMKKIKLSLTTKAQREAKEQAAQAAKPAPAPAKTKPASKVATTKVSRARVAEKAAANKQPPPSSLQESTSAEPSTASILQDHVSTSTVAPPVSLADPGNSSPQNPPPPHLQQANDVTLPSSSPPIPHTGIEQRKVFPTPQTSFPRPPTPKSPDVFIAYQPEGPTPDTLSQQEPLRWLPPNTSTPSPMKRADLPVFTSTSAIPFGVKLSLASTPVSQPDGVATDVTNFKDEGLKDETDIWEVPETPRK